MWIGSNDHEALRCLHKAVDMGLNFIDTAYEYGHGHSERLIGQLLRERSEQVYVATKLPPKNWQWPARSGVPVEAVFPKEHIIAHTENSLRDLGVDTIDVMQFHVWSDEWVDQGDWYEAIEALKQEGKIRFFGVSVNDHQPANVIGLIRTGVVDTVQVLYNIFDPTAEDVLFPVCSESNVGVIARVPFDEGGLTGKITPDSSLPANDFRNRYFRGDRKNDVAARVQAIASDLGISIEHMPEIALRFVLGNPTVTTVIPGMRSQSHVEANCRTGDGMGLPTALLHRLRKHSWLRNFYE